MFYNCSTLTSLDVSNFNTSNVTDMMWMFGGERDKTMNLKEIRGVEKFNTSKVTSMPGIFQNCKKLSSLDLSGWDTRNVTDMGWMFFRCNNLTTTITIKGKVTEFDGMFKDVSTEAGSKITVNYTNDTSSIVDNMIKTKSPSSNVVKRNQVE